MEATSSPQSACRSRHLVGCKPLRSRRKLLSLGTQVSDVYLRVELYQIADTQGATVGAYNIVKKDFSRGRLGRVNIES